MAFLKRVTNPDGSQQLVRPAFRAQDYVLPEGDLHQMRSYIGGPETFDELRSDREMTLKDYVEMERFERDGKTHVVLISHAAGWPIEVVLDGAVIGSVDRLAPERGYELARRLDADSATKVVAL